MTHSQTSPWIIIISLLVTYIICDKKHVRPPGHPWAGISILLLALNQFFAAYHLPFMISKYGQNAVSIAGEIVAFFWIVFSVSLLKKTPKQ